MLLLWTSLENQLLLGPQSIKKHLYRIHLIVFALSALYYLNVVGLKTAFT